MPITPRSSSYLSNHSAPHRRGHFNSIHSFIPTRVTLLFSTSTHDFFPKSPIHSLTTSYTTLPFYKRYSRESEIHIKDKKDNMDMDQMGAMGAQAGFPLETWFWEMPLCTRWWTTATVLTSALVQCQIVTPFQLFYSFRAVFYKNQVFPPLLLLPLPNTNTKNLDD
jgi:hypothetical protein